MITQTDAAYSDSGDCGKCVTLTESFVTCQLIILSHPYLFRDYGHLVSILPKYSKNSTVLIKEFVGLHFFVRG